MSLTRGTHRRTILLTLHSLALSLAVILWGAAYKMEQYPQHGLAFRVISPAKLLTEKERGTQKRSVQVTLSQAKQMRDTGSPSAWAAIESSPRVLPPPGYKQPVILVYDVDGSPQFTYFSFRPPPAKLLF